MVITFISHEIWVLTAEQMKQETLMHVSENGHRAKSLDETD